MFHHFVDHDYLSAETIVQQEGYALMYISNEDETQVDAYFDDVVMSYTPTAVIQSSNFYAFGLQTNDSWTRDGSENRYLYNSGSELNKTTGSYEMYFRSYDPVIGRMSGVDVMADSYSSLTPYQYANNDPIFFNDPTGAAAQYERASTGGCGCWRDKGAQDGGGARAEYNTATYGSGFEQYGTGGQGQYQNAGAFIMSALNSMFGGSWSNGQTHMFTSDREAFDSGVEYNDDHNSWGETLHKNADASFAAFTLIDVTAKFYAQLARTELFYTIMKEIFDRENFNVPGNKAVEKLRFFASTMSHGKQFDIKQAGKGFHYTEIGNRAIFDGEEVNWTSFGNINYGLAARIFGIPLELALDAGGLQQVFGNGEGNIDPSNGRHFFDESMDSDMITRGYNMKLPWD